MSTSNKYPDAEKNIKNLHQNETKCVYYAKSKTQKFQEQHLYVSFDSETEANIRITVQYGLDQDRNRSMEKQE